MSNDDWIIFGVCIFALVGCVFAAIKYPSKSPYEWPSENDWPPYL